MSYSRYIPRPQPYVQTSDGGYARFVGFGGVPGPASLGSWDPSQATLFSWFRADNVTGSGSAVTALMDKSSNGYSVNCIHNPVNPHGSDNLTLIAGPNSQPALQMPSAFSGGQFATITGVNPGPPTSHAMIGPNKVWSVGYAGKLGTILGANQYTALFTLAGTAAATSATMYITNIAAMPTFYFQYGSGTCTIIGSDTTFDYTDYFQFLLTFNGAADPTNAANYTLTINHTPYAVKSYSAAGGCEPICWLGDQGDAPGISPGVVADFMLAQSLVKPMDWGTYMTSRYNL